MNKFSFTDFQEIISSYKCKLNGIYDKAIISRASTPADASPDSLTWVSTKVQDKISVISQSKAGLIICDYDLELPEKICKEKGFIQVENPKLIFSLIVNRFFSDKPSPQIHPSASIHPEAKIAADVYIGPFSHIGRSVIGSGTVIWGQCFVYDNVEIGNNCEIHAGCILGAPGSGYAKNDKGEWIKFPHIGSTIIEDNVEVGANTYINKGALGSTIVKRGAKIGLSVCIGHNVKVGENTIVLANALIAGSTEIGDNTWVSASASVKNGIKVGSGVTIGLGAVVLKDVKNNSTVIGNPAIELEEYKKWSEVRRTLIASKKL